jgi:hypothetical protein
MKINFSSVLASLAILDAFAVAAPLPTQGGEPEVSTVYQSNQGFWLKYRLPTLTKSSRNDSRRRPTPALLL